MQTKDHENKSWLVLHYPFKLEQQCGTVITITAK